MLGRLVIDNVRPCTLSPEHPPKAAVGDLVPVRAWIHRDGHDQLAGRVWWRPARHDAPWQTVPLDELGNDEWAATFEPAETGLHELAVEAWADHFATWLRELPIRRGANDDLGPEMEVGAVLVERLLPNLPEGTSDADRHYLTDVAAQLRRQDCSVEVRVDAALDPRLRDLLAGVPDPHDRAMSQAFALWVDRPLARSSAWYELFPRSCGGLLKASERLAAVAEMGFDIVYLPPIHPIGTTARKGRDNSLVAAPADPGSPWAIGGPEGGHTAVHPDLGTLADFDHFVARAADHGLEVALDYALQCSPDHPWVVEHPEWFHHLPDGRIRYAENPPKKYQDIYPIAFWPEGPDGRPDEAARVALWTACKEVLDHWIRHGVSVFRVDNPHTKPMAFWEWLLPAVRAEHPEVIFLAEAFTRPKVMAKLAEVGFTQSYTYFTWRHSRQELTDYLVELSQGPTADYLRPNFWPNTPDILGGVLRNGPRAAFELRAVLAALLSPSWGVYSGYELCENEPASDANEEYLHSEKYELRERDWDDPSSLAPLLGRLNALRKAHPAFAELRTTRFHGADDEAVIVWSKTAADGSDPMVVVVNLDPSAPHAASLSLDLAALGLPWDADIVATDELGETTFSWHGPNPWVRLDPAVQVAHVVSLKVR